MEPLLLWTGLFFLLYRVLLLKYECLLLFERTERSTDVVHLIIYTSYQFRWHFVCFRTMQQENGQISRIQQFLQKKMINHQIAAYLKGINICGFNFTNVIVCRAMMPLYCCLENVQALNTSWTISGEPLVGSGGQWNPYFWSNDK